MTGDLSKNARHSFDELVNTIVIGFILVLIILMFFMGVTNAFFVALSVAAEHVCGVYVFARSRL